MTLDLAKLRAETLALTKGATPGPWIFYADLPSVEPDWHIVTTENRLRVLANVHIEPGNVADNANARLIAAAPTLAADTLRLLDEIERLTADMADLKASVVTFAAPHAVKYARDFGLPDGQLHPVHFDILERAGARMDDFTRAALPEGGPDDR